MFEVDDGLCSFLQPRKSRQERDSVGLPILQHDGLSKVILDSCELAVVGRSQMTILQGLSVVSSVHLGVAHTLLSCRYGPGALVSTLWNHPMYLRLTGG